MMPKHGAPRCMLRLVEGRRRRAQHSPMCLGVKRVFFYLAAVVVAPVDLRLRVTGRFLEI